MITENPEDKKELDKIPETDKHGDPIYKIDEEEIAKSFENVPVGELSNTADVSEFKHSPQDLKDETSQE